MGNATLPNSRLKRNLLNHTKWVATKKQTYQEALGRLQPNVTKKLQSIPKEASHV